VGLQGSRGFYVTPSIDLDSLAIRVIISAMVEDSRKKFDAGAKAWAAYNQAPLGRIRQEVTWHNLAPYLPQVTADSKGLPAAGQPRRVLDAGGGSGELAVRLARRGYHVWLVDHAEAMLDQARQLARGLPAADQARLTFCLMSAEEAAGSFATGSFHAIACHTLIEYLPQPRDTLRELARLLRPGGVLSLSFVNHHAEVLRQLWRQGNAEGMPVVLAAALAQIVPPGDAGNPTPGAGQAHFRATLFDLPGRAYTADEVSAWLAELGLTVTAHLGVRAFADQICQQHGTGCLDAQRADLWEALLRLELAAASRSPYKLIARYVHLIAHRAAGTGSG
jgi:S-adenosylmethionine-dependent methyltransferase